ncbi:hypothetical protein ABZ897_42865 [Nonomuraea sp. NPDC046802]|uniref:hypothetical protein n=1 Tax=Nonomuraea sp. NPDC046802 TaxID=3154919 RepID=UPI0033D4B197
MGRMPEPSESIHPAYEPVYEVVKVVRLPVPNEIREPPCMIGPKVWVGRRIRRLAPWLVPRQAPRACCWHHQVDWHQAAAAAIRLLREAQAAGLRGEGISDYVLGRLDEQGLGDREQDAVLALGCTGGIEPNTEPDAKWRYYEGQHRVAAQLDQGVRETVVQRWVPLGPATGQL